LLTGATACVNLAPARRRSAAADDYRHAVHTDTRKDVLGTARRLTAVCQDPRKEVDLELRVSIYDEFPAIAVDVSCRNVSGRDLAIHSLEPVRAVEREGGALHSAGVSKCLTNGEMYFDTGSLHELGTRGGAISSGRLKGVTLANGPIGGEHATIHSWWNVCLFRGYDQPGIVLGFLENSLGLGNLLVSKAAAGTNSFVAESVHAPLVTLRPGQTIRSTPLLIMSAANPYAALERYAGAVGKAHRARTRSIVNGWSSWFYTLSQVSEAEMVANSAFAAKHLKPFGLEYIQVDEGFQRWHGDWEGNERFPHGMKWLADRIRSDGFKPGIWLSPYVISEPTEVFREHPEWLVKNPDGSPQRIGNWPADAAPPADEKPRRYCLDITHPGAARWLHRLVDTVANDWGYEMIKIDFVAWSILAARRYHDSAVSSAQAYRRGMEIMRRAAGDRCHILECGPGATTVGLIDSMRIEADVYYGFAEAAWDTYFRHPACSASAAAKRFYFHKRTWINDVDHLCTDLLNNQQAEAAATLIAMSGGNMMSGDRLTHLEPYKIEVLKKITPAFGEAAIPVDLFDTDMPSVFALRIEKPFGEWTVAAFFNADLTAQIEKQFPLSRLWLAPGKTYVAFDFWKQQLIGEVKDEVKVRVQPGSVTLLALHERPDRPRVISTDRHVLQGAVEIRDTRWDEGSRTLTGVSIGPRHTTHTVSVYVPGKHPWTWDGSAFFRDHGSYSLRLVDSNVIEVRVRFDASEEVRWKIERAA
jgi:Melibiase